MERQYWFSLVAVAISVAMLAPGHCPVVAQQSGGSSSVLFPSSAEIPGEGPVAEYYRRRNLQWVPALNHWTTVLNEWESGVYNVTCQPVPNFTSTTSSYPVDPSAASSTVADPTNSQSDAQLLADYERQLAAWDAELLTYDNRMNQWQTEMQRLVCS
eukprot:scpid87288/ scgid34647/ 